MTKEKEYCYGCETREDPKCGGPREEPRVCPYTEEIHGEIFYCNCCDHEYDDCCESI